MGRLELIRSKTARTSAKDLKLGIKSLSHANVFDLISRQWLVFEEEESNTANTLGKLQTGHGL